MGCFRTPESCDFERLRKPFPSAHSPSTHPCCCLHTVVHTLHLGRHKAPLAMQASISLLGSGSRYRNLFGVNIACDVPFLKATLPSYVQPLCSRCGRNTEAHACDEDMCVPGRSESCKCASMAMACSYTVDQPI